MRRANAGGLAAAAGGGGGGGGGAGGGGWAFRSGRVNSDADHRGRGAGGVSMGISSRRTKGTRSTMDLGKLGRHAELGVQDGAGARQRSSGIAAFFRALFSRSEDHRTRPVPRDGIAPAGGRYGSLRSGGLPSSGRLDRATAASSLGSLQSYATSTIRGSTTLPGCLSPSSTSEVDMRKRVDVKRDESERPVFSAEMRNSTLMSNRPQRFDYPNFQLGEYGGRDTWPSDVFVLLHNAIRWEIMDVYNILGSIQRRWPALQMVDVWDFSEYWEVFEVFVAQYFEIEDQIIFPFMLNVAADSSELARYHKVVKYNKERLEGMLLDIGMTLEKFNTTAAGEVMPTLYKQLVDCLPKLLDYMAEQEKVLPRVFEQYCDPEDRTLLNRASANFLVRAANGRDGIAILTRWIEDSMILQVWKNENLSPRAKSSHKKWIQSLQQNHVEIVQRFQRRMRDLGKEKRRAQSSTTDEMRGAGSIRAHV